MSFEGGCHCGGLRYRVDGPVKWGTYCHCRICQLTLGASVSAFASVSQDHFCYTKGEPKVYRSSAEAVREFCGNCRAQLVFRRDGKHRLGVNIVTFDDPAIIEPTMHIWTESRIPWFDTKDGHERRRQVQPHPSPAHPSTNSE